MNTKTSKQITSPNDVSAFLYDIVNSKLRPKQLLDKEIRLIEEEIKKLNKQSIRILDIGAGTGKHAIQLWKKGYEVTGVEISLGMITEFKLKIERLLRETTYQRSKLNRPKIFNSSIFDFYSAEKFDIIILFWNTWNEIALNDELAQKLMFKLSNLLEPTGCIIINSDDPEKIDFKNLYFESEVENYYEETSTLKKYLQTWQTISWDDKLKRSTAIERIYDKSLCVDNSELDGKGNLITTTQIEQRWYSFDDIKNLAHKFGMSVDVLHITGIGEMYLKLNSGFGLVD
jgi:SAM-dependent methyltransferase